MTKEAVSTDNPAPTMEDTIRETYRSLGKPDLSKEEPTPTEPVEATTEETTEPVDLTVEPEETEEGVEEKTPSKAKQDKAKKQKRGEDGKFTKTEGEEAAVEDAVEAPVEEAKPVVPSKHEKAPSSWSGPAQAEWAKLPEAIKQEVYRREENFHKGLESYRGYADIGRTLDNEIRPYEAMIRAANTTPQALIRDTFNTLYVLKTGSPEQKAQAMLEVIATYGVDMGAIETAAQKIAAGEPVMDPRVAQLMKEQQDIKTFLETQRKQQEEQEQARVVSELTAFEQAVGADGKLLRPHAVTVRQQMAALIESGEASDFQDAYDKAVWIVPSVRSNLLAEQQAADAKRRAEKVAQAKKAAAVNVVKRATPPAQKQPGTMEDTIRDTLRKLNGVT